MAEGDVHGAQAFRRARRIVRKNLDQMVQVQVAIAKGRRFQLRNEDGTPARKLRRDGSGSDPIWITPKPADTQASYKLLMDRFYGAVKQQLDVDLTDERSDAQRVPWQALPAADQAQLLTLAHKALLHAEPIEVTPISVDEHSAVSEVSDPAVLGEGAADGHSDGPEGEGTR